MQSVTAAANTKEEHKSIQVNLTCKANWKYISTPDRQEDKFQIHNAEMEVFDDSRHFNLLKVFCTIKNYNFVNIVGAFWNDTHTWYLSLFSHKQGLKILHLKVGNFATKIVSRQNSVNHHSRAKFHIYFKQCKHCE